MVLGYLNSFPWGGPTTFMADIISGAKVHTIRRDKTDRWKSGVVISHVIGNRTKSRSEFSTGECVSTQRVVIVFSQLGKVESVKVDGAVISGWEVIAANDGLSILGFESFFYSMSFDGIYIGKIIHWTNLKY